MPTHRSMSLANKCSLYRGTRPLTEGLEQRKDGKHFLSGATGRGVHIRRVFYMLRVVRTPTLLDDRSLNQGRSPPPSISYKKKVLGRVIHEKDGNRNKQIALQGRQKMCMVKIPETSPRLLINLNPRLRHPCAAVATAVPLLQHPS